MSVLEFAGAAFILFLIFLGGYVVGYHVGYRDGAAGRPRNWSKTRRPPSVTEQ